MTERFDQQQPSQEATQPMPERIYAEEEYVREWFAGLPIPGEKPLDDEVYQQHSTALRELYGYDPNNPRDEMFLNSKLYRLGLLNVDPAESDMLTRSFAEELGRDIVHLTLTDAYAEHTARTLSELASRDPLTKAWNRLGSENITNGWLRPEQKGKERAIFDIDVTFFKQINDVLGHHIGDQALAEILIEITQTVRQEDNVELIRWGGDEFRILASNIDGTGFKSLYGRLLGSQFDKLANETDPTRNIDMWERIIEMKAAIETSGRTCVTTVEAEAVALPDGGGEQITRYLCINGARVAAMRDLVVLSIGGAHGAVNTIEDIEHLEHQSHELGLDHKRRLHRRMRTYVRPIEE